MSQPLSGADLLARIKPMLREESTQICLRPDLLDEWDAANSALAASQVEDSSGRLASGVSSKTRGLAQKVADLEAAIEESAITFKFRAIPKDRYRAVCDNHPPRKGNEIDQLLGHNRDAVADAMVRECLIDPVFDDESWAHFLEVCNPSEWQELKHAVQSVNRGVVDLPKSELASRILTKRANASKSPKPGE